MSERTRTPYFAIRHSGIHGRGAFALRRIRKGTRIIEYTGEHISNAEGDARYPVNGHLHYHTFLFSLGRHGCIDAGKGGNESRFINHCCDPNCEAVQDEGGRIFIEAICNIQPGAELTYDYNMFGISPRTKRERALFACYCGAPNCRGVMLGSTRYRAQSSRA
jgi:uncharacterized protein